MVASGTPWESSSTVSRSGHLVASMRRRSSVSSDSSKPISNWRSALRHVRWLLLRTSWSSCQVVDVARAGAKKSIEQLVDALGLVVMDPVRGVGQALDAVEVGHVVVVGLGQRRAEVAVALAPDDQRGRRYGTDLT